MKIITTIYITKKLITKRLRDTGYQALARLHSFCMRHEWARKVVASIINTWQWARPSRYAGRRRTLQRLGNTAALVVILASVVTPVISGFMSARAYALSPEVNHLVGKANKNIAKKLVYDAQSGAYVFNQKGMAGNTTVGPGKIPMKMLQAQTGGDKGKSNQLYSVKLPVNASSGITYYDNNLGVSFSVVPNFRTSAAKKVDNHVVYLGDNGVKAIYTAKNNGLKEDYVLTKPITNELTFGYKLNLPKTLEAKLLPDGSGAVGIYSADPAVFASVNTSGDPSDAAALQKAQVKGKKTNLVFAIPAPTIKQSGGEQGNSARASFSLENNTLKVSASGLSQLHYPASIDPSVVVSSASDFASGNNEGNIAFNGGEVDRGGLSGGGLNTASGSWDTTNSVPTAVSGATSVAYNGYIYELGGSTSNDGASAVTTIYYAPLNANGTIGTWVNDTASPLPLALDFSSTVVYNGYIYELGGYNPNGIYITSNTYYAPLNADGSIGTWIPTTSLGRKMSTTVAAVYNGYIYTVGGNSSSNQTFANTYYAPINANGSIGTWVNDTTSPLPQALSDGTGGAYNGYIYEMGGVNSGGGSVANTYYAPLNADGTVGSWASSTAMPSTDTQATSVISNGYIYELAGGDINGETYYAPLNANGTIGAWAQSTTLPDANLYFASAAVYNGYVYQLAGGSYGAPVTDVFYAKIDPAGVTGTFNAGTVIPKSIYGNQSFAYNGYLYVVGGYETSTSTYSLSTYYTPISSSGSIGAWGTTTALTAAQERYLFGLAVYKGRVYIIDGNNSGGATKTVYSSVINNTNGKLGSWTSATPTPVGTGWLTAQAYNGYLYAIGGASNKHNVSYAPINSDGSLGSWTTASSFNTSRTDPQAFAYNGYMYVVGGTDNANTTWYSDVEYAPINSDGSLGTWVANPTTFSGGRQDFGIAVNNGVVYLTGGHNNHIGTNSVQYAQINNGGSGTAGGWQTATNTFTAGRDAQATAVYNGYLYILGGHTNSSSLDDVQYTKLGADGSPGVWQTASNTFTTGRYAFKAVAYNGYFYIMGGYNGSDYNDVQYASINSDGSLGVWHTNSTSFSGIRDSFAAAQYNGYLYIMGGCNSSSGCTEYNDVQYAKISADGSVGAWTTSSNSFTTGRDWLDGFAYNGYLYIMGGENGSTDLNDAQYAPINADGSVGVWQATTSIPSARQGMTISASNGYVYLMGGDTAYTGSDLTDVEYAPINANGALGNWQTTTSYSGAREWATSAIYDGYLYLMGGYNGTTRLDDTQYASLNSISKVGHYSKLVDLGTGSGVLSSISYNGNLPGGLANISYRTAGSDGNFGTLTSATNIPTSGGGASCAGNGTGGTQYVELFVTLDDSGQASFPDSAGADANLTDLTVNYTVNSGHPPPNIRLRGGQTLQTGTLSPFDTCGSLVAWYKLDGNATDQTANANNGTVFGATATTDRFANPSSAYSFNGTSNYIQVPNASQLNLNGSFTVSFWYKDNGSTTTYPSILNKSGGYTVGNGWEIYFKPSNKNISFKRDNIEEVVPGAVTTSWTHYVYTYDGTNWKWYINGSVSTSGTVSYVTDTSTDPAYLGNDGGIQYSKGGLDDTRIYNHALDSSQVQSLYNATQ